ncbi:MAG: sensor histidine kinase [Hyphomonas sp.]|nr:sensor histidine kinase [Hyphomonas sp.]
MQEEAATARPARRMSLRWRVIVAMAAALSPLLILGGIRVLSEQEAARKDQLQALVEVSSAGQVSINSVLEGARLALRMVAADSRDPSCAQIGAQLTFAKLPYRNVVRFNQDGGVTCYLVGENLIDKTMPDPQWNDSLRKGKRQIESTHHAELALDEPAIWFVHSVVGADESFAGSVAITISMAELASSLPPVVSAPGLKQALVKVNGEVLGSDVVSRVPVDWLTSEAMLERELRTLVLPKGGQFSVVLLPLFVSDLWIMSPTATSRQPRMESLIAILIPLLAYLAALLAATWIIDTLVLRWLERLRLRISGTRPDGDRTPLAQDLVGAPSELQQLGDEFDALRERVTVHELDLQKALDRMKGAFRETHHRVKNNLQVMLSMLKLQGRGETRAETQQALRVAAHRVSMMAAVHHALLNESHLETVDAGDLFDTICNQIHERQGWGEESRHIHPDVSNVPLPSDIAVPLAMFVQEAFDLLCPPSEIGADIRDLNLEFRHENKLGRLRLGCGPQPKAADAVTGNRDANTFLLAFARQMEGSVEHWGDDPENVIIVLTFPLDSAAEH